MLQSLKRLFCESGGLFLLLYFHFTFYYYFFLLQLFALNKNNEVFMLWYYDIIVESRIDICDNDSLLSLERKNPKVGSRMLTLHSPRRRQDKCSDIQKF